MDHIELPIWNKCNNYCLMCTNNELMLKGNCFDYPSVINYLETELKKNNCTSLKSIGLTGGETTICPSLFKIMDYIYQKFPEINVKLLTNGRMFIYDNFRKKCLALKNIDFIIPLHGHNEEIHDKITQVPGSFSQTVEGLKKIYNEKKADQKIEIRIIATRLNLKVIPKICAFIKNNFIGADRVILIFLEFEGKAEINKDEVGITYTQIQPALKQIKKYFKIFKDFRLYHFPLCVLDSSLWPYTWRTLPNDEVTYLPECQKCRLKKYCLGVHKSYFDYVKKPEIKPRLSLRTIKIKETKNFYHPIDSIQADNNIV